MHKKKKHNIRYIAIALLLIAILLVYNFRLIRLQVLDADYYLSQASTASTRMGVPSGRVSSSGALGPAMRPS